MSKQQIETIISQVAKGYRQRYALYELLTNGKTYFVDYCNHATSFYGSAKNSFYNMLQRLDATGVQYKLVHGKRGGMWTAYVTLV